MIIATIANDVAGMKNEAVAAGVRMEEDMSFTSFTSQSSTTWSSDSLMKSVSYVR